MTRKMTKLTVTVFALIALLAGAASADVLLDQSDYFIPDGEGGFLNGVGGFGPFGSALYSVNDITVGGPGWTITSISIYVNALGSYPGSFTTGYVNIMPKTGSLPVDPPNQDTTVDVTVTHVEGDCYKVTATGYIYLAPGEYWIGLTPAVNAYDGIQYRSMTYLGDDTATYDANGFPAPMWYAPIAGFDAAMLIEGVNEVVANESATWGDVKSLYR